MYDIYRLIDIILSILLMAFGHNLGEFVSANVNSLIISSYRISLNSSRQKIILKNSIFVDFMKFRIMLIEGCYIFPLLLSCQRPEFITLKTDLVDHPALIDASSHGIPDMFFSILVGSGSSGCVRIFFKIIRYLILVYGLKLSL